MNDDEQINALVISTGHSEIDKKLGGGVPVGSLVLIEGESDAGKSVLCQQMIWGSLNNGVKVLLFTTENSVRSLIPQTDSLGLGILDHLLLGWLKIYAVKPSQVKDMPHQAFEVLLNTVKKNKAYALTIIDALTPMVTQSTDAEILNYFEHCRNLCDKGKTIVNVIHTYALNQDILIRVRSACDAHLRLMIEKVGDKLVKTLEVAKIRGAAQNTGNILTFEVEPEIGMKIMPISRAKA
jgi:archaeal flagellar protein FlaH